MNTIFRLNYTCIDYNLGCKRVRKGANGCGWVWIGAMGYRGHRWMQKQGRQSEKLVL